MVTIRQRGLDRSQEQVSSALIRDTRTMGEKAGDFFKNSAAVSVVLFAFSLGSFILPAVADLLLLAGIAMFFISKGQHISLPFRMPKRSKLKDYNSPMHGSNKPSEAAGIYFFGNDIKSDEEL